MTTPLRIRLLWHPQPQFAGYLIAEAEGLGAESGIAIACQPMRTGEGPIAALLSGAAEFAVASPSHMLESGAAEDLVLLLAIQQRSALVYPSRQAAGITQLSDLRGKRIAVWPGGEDLEIRWMLHHAGVAASEVTWVPVGDTSGCLLADEADCAQMTSYHEIGQFAHRGADLRDFTIFEASEKTALLKDGLVARRDWVTAHPAETQAVVNAVLAGWRTAFTDPARAIAICAKARPDMPPDEHALQLAKIRKLSLCNATLVYGLGYPDPQHLVRAEVALAGVEGHLVQGHVDLRFWLGAPAALRPIIAW
jgi:NitT/TauT family transport system substrate-binding protein